MDYITYYFICMFRKRIKPIKIDNYTYAAETKYSLTSNRKRVANHTDL